MKLLFSQRVTDICAHQDKNKLTRKATQLQVQKLLLDLTGHKIIKNKSSILYLLHKLSQQNEESAKSGTVHVGSIFNNQLERIQAS